jgi:hypothetical protein
MFFTAALLPIGEAASAADFSSDNERDLSVGQENIVLRARQVYEIEWTPLRDVIHWGERGIFKAGVTVQGLPYGMPAERNYVPLRTSFSEFLDMVDNRSSRFYTSVAIRHRRAPYLSLDCSAFVSYAWGLETRHMTGALPSVATNLGTNLQNIQVGDALNNPGLHVVLVTYIRYNEDNEISAMGIMELDPPKAKYTLYGEDGDFPLTDVQRRYLNRGFSILRYKERDSVVYLHDCVVPVDGDYCNKCSYTDFASRLWFLDSYRDVQYTDIIRLAEQIGVFNGQSQSSLPYDFEMRRGMFAYLFSKHVSADISAYDESVFEDVHIDEWYSQAIAWIVDIGLISVDGDRFKPNQYISTEEVVHILFEHFIMRNNRAAVSNPLIMLNTVLAGQGDGSSVLGQYN